MSRAPLPQRPFRDSAFFNAVLAGVVVIVGVLTGNDTRKTVGVAVVFFVVATGYSWLRYRQRLAAERRGR